MQIHKLSAGPLGRCPKTLQIQVDDPVVLEELSSRDGLQAQCEYGEELLELGARVARTQRPLSEADRVASVMEDFEHRSERRFDAMGSLLEQRVGSAETALLGTQALLETKVSSLMTSLDHSATHRQRLIGTLQEQVESTLKVLLERVEDGLERAGADSHTLASTFEKNLSDCLDSLQAQVGRAEQVIASGLDREQALLLQQNLSDKASAKGVKFEQLVQQKLASFGRGRGDHVEAVGATSSKGTNSKKGDLIYQMQVASGQVPVIIECKDTSMTMSGRNPFFLSDLETAMRERGGKYGIVVGTLEANSDQNGPKFPVLQFHGKDRFVVLLDQDQEFPVALETVMHLIHRAESQPKTKEQPAIDLAAVGQVVEMIDRTSSVCAHLKGTCTNLGNHIQTLRDQIDKMDDDLEAQTDKLRSLLGLAA